MGHEVFQLVTVTRGLGEGVRVVEALGLPEISAVADSAAGGTTTLRTKAKTLLEDPALSPALRLFRRRFGAEAVLDEVELPLAPPKHAPAWQEPVVLRLLFVRWVEQELHLAFVPALGVLVFATREDALPKQVLDHARLVLAGRHQLTSLRELARLARLEELSLDRLEVATELKTPRQVAEAEDREEKEPSLLEKMAEELPPCLGQEKRAETGPAEERAFELETELAGLAEALGGVVRRSALLVGPAGGGKTALVRELARRRSELGFAETPFWTTSGARLMSGPVGFGLWQERCQQMCREASRSRAILHVNHLVELLEVGKARRGEQSVGGFLRPWIARGDLTVIAEATPEQLGRLERLEPHLLGAFRQLTFTERTEAQTRAILERVFAAAPGPGPAAEQRPALAIALHRLHLLHQRYATYSANPGRAVRFLKNLLADRFPDKTLVEEAVVTAFGRETGLPAVLLDDAVPLDLEATRRWFEQRILGQPEAVARVLDLLALIKARLARPGKPLASLLFVGPTGTGKTEMAKALAAFFFGDATRLARFDLNEFSDPLAVQRLIGGAGAAEAEGLLTARVREQPFGVILLDEFEKADPSFFDLLLQMLGDGRLTDAVGRVADFRNCVVVMTSNLGAQGFQRGPAGFRGDGQVILEAETHFTAAVRQFLRPEIFNRLDAVVPFQPLAAETVLALARRQVELVGQRDGLRLRPVELEVAPGVVEHLGARGYEPRYGARPLQRTVERELVVPLAEALIAYPVTTPVRAEVSVQAGALRIHVRARPEAASNPVQTVSQARSALATEIVARRRRIGRLLGCDLVGDLENRMTMLAALERRLARAERKPAVPDPRLAVLPHLRSCLEKLARLAEQACELEDNALAALHGGAAFEAERWRSRLEELTVELQQRQREVFRLHDPACDEVILGFYSEQPGAVARWASAYRGLAEPGGRLVAMEALLPPATGRSASLRFLRKAVAKPGPFLAAPPAKLLGVVLHLRGDLFHPRLAGETGLHQLTEKNARHECLIESAAPPLAKYEPPEGMERPGSITALRGGFRRRFHADKREVLDSNLGKRRWVPTDLASAIATLTQEQLLQTLEEATS